MRAMVYTGPLKLEILDLDMPVAEREEVLVRVDAAGICGSELEGFTSKSSFRVPPLVMGHEFVGWRVDTGKPVFVNPLVSCGTCDLCRRDRANICRARSIIGIQRPGGFADFVAVPARNCVELPNDDALAVAILIEPLANATHALDLAIDKVDPPRRVGVIGAGTLGFLTAFSAVTQGVPEVVISDLSAQRRSLAGASGAHLVVENLEGEFDVIVDAVGTDTTRAASVELVRPGGAAAWVGLHATRSAVDGLDVIRAEKRIVGSFCYHERDVTTAVGLLSTLDSAWIARRPLEDGVETFLRLASGDHSALKTALVAGGAS